jgi:TctA family transporter
MTRKGQAEVALGAGLWFWAIGGIAGTLSLMVLAVEQSFLTSLIKSDGSILPFFERPVSAVLASLTNARNDVTARGA